MKHQYSLGLVRDGYAVSEYGIIKIVDGQVYLCDCNVADLAREFEGSWVEISICSPSPSDKIPIDPKILPLVERLEALGAHPISSCEGHMEENYRHYPFVSTLGKPDIPLAEGWRITAIGTNLWRIESVGDAHSDEELTALQKTIFDQIAILA